MTSWYLLVVRLPKGSKLPNDPEVVAGVSRNLNDAFPAAFISFEQVPCRRRDGNWNVLVWDRAALPQVKEYLQRQYALDIVREIGYE
jgi:hypothetical protein